MIRKHLPVLILLGISIALLLFFLFWHFRLGQIRYFDVDEYAHLHWTAKLLQGKRPYVDFLTFFPPGYWVFLSLSFIGGWGTTAPFLAARMWQFVVFAGMAAASGYLFFLIRRSWAAVLAALFLAFLPLPFDKYLEIRPDSLATLFMLLAIIAQVRWMEGKRGIVSGFLSGMFWSLTLLTLPKMLPNATIGALAFVFIPYVQESGGFRNRMGKVIQAAKFPFFGCAVPALLFGVWALTLGDPALVIYSLTMLPIEANKISRYFIMMPDLFFYPNGIFYGQNGWHPGIYANHLLYMFGALFAVYRLVAPAIARGRHGMWGELFIASQFLIQVILYIQVVPLKHAQYLIPIGVFVAFYAADFVNSLWITARKTSAGRGVFIVLFLLMGVSLYRIFLTVNSVKETWTNTEGLSEIAGLYRAIPAGSYVFDLDGRFLYNPDPYYGCCIPFGQFSEFLTRPLPDLEAALEFTKTKYINQGELKRVTTLPWEAQTYIGSFYRLMDGHPIILQRF